MTGNWQAGRTTELAAMHFLQAKGYVTLYFIEI